jgi:hypothetical protein
MPRSVRQKVIAAAAVAVLLGGVSFAAVSATGESNGRGWPRAHSLHHLRPADLQAAAGYLGVSSEQLAHELSSKSLAQVAEAHSGKSAQGLVEAIVAARRARLAKVSATLPKRVQAEVSRTVEPGAPSSHARVLSLFTAPRHLGAAAAGYLGSTPTQLRTQLRAGESLAQIARATPGKSKAGLVAALVAAKQKRIAAHVATHRLTQARAARRERRLRARIDVLVERKFAGSHES